ncbi:MAG: hypothetical protein Q9163_000943 [Psora crenata]
MAMTVEHSEVPIIDIRREELEHSILDDLRQTLQSSGDGAEMRIPTVLLYDEMGLKLFEDITYLEEYYLTNYEIEILQKHADEIAGHIQVGSLVLELGSGNLRKVKVLLNAFEKAAKNINYYALDLNRAELERTLSAVTGVYKSVRCFGLLGTYDDGLAWLQRSENIHKPKSVLWMGHSIGNLDRTEAVAFLKSYSTILQPRDTMIVGLDACQDSDKVFRAYNDKQGKTHEFVLNGLVHANKLMGKKVFEPMEWAVIGEYDTEAGCHRAFCSPKKDVCVEGSLIKAGEKIKVEESHKYSPDQSIKLWENVGLVPRAKYGNNSNEYHVHILSKPPLFFGTKPEEYAARPVPSLQEFEQLWGAWDLVTRHMIPQQEMLSKPIKLRNACIFYLGHIPAFLDLQLTRATGEPPTQPAFYHQMFERGIDPDVDNPEHCHAHSEIPDAWPPLEDILGYQERVRERIRTLVQSKDISNDRNLGRAIWLGFEHEGKWAMHLETLLYMLLQSDKTVPPSNMTPDFEALAKQAEGDAIPNEWIRIPQTCLKIGMDDPETVGGPDHHFGLDNEKPQRTIKVNAFLAQARPLTNEDYARFLEQTGWDDIPASWMVMPGPSSPEADGYAHVNGHRRFANADGPSAPLTDAFLKGKHLSNEGVEISPPSHLLQNGASGAEKTTEPYQLFADLEGCNIGLKTFHPIPISHKGRELCGRGGLGGVWEWTSSVLERHDGFEAGKLYPAYTGDFNVIKRH